MPAKFTLCQISNTAGSTVTNHEIFTFSVKEEKKKCHKQKTSGWHLVFGWFLEHWWSLECSYWLLENCPAVAKVFSVVRRWLIGHCNAFAKEF